MEYTDKVLDHFMNPRNIGQLSDANAIASEGSPACGDQVNFYLRINKETLIIEDVRFLSYGCASNIATASVTSEIVKGKTINEAKNITWKTITESLGGLPPTKVHCSVLAVDTLKRAINNFEITNKLIDPYLLTKQMIIDELKNVIYSQAGEDIVTLKMLKYISFENNEVTIQLDMPKFCTHKTAIIDEIKEHLKKFTTIKNINFIE
jgi:nitrogen fixation NifU-like protein